ncbi:E1-E2 ATPase-domain-containing protein [Lipomyces oligophaga]|uniref:E1-E2 ATPase-domain-containing protein n=1 Tax=Lipomyces oligophaga TaxID=45792 RepID=UPI0034CF6353
MTGPACADEQKSTAAGVLSSCSMDCSEDCCSHEIGIGEVDCHDDCCENNHSESCSSDEDNSDDCCSDCGSEDTCCSSASDISVCNEDNKDGIECCKNGFDVSLDSEGGHVHGHKHMHRSQTKKGPLISCCAVLPSLEASTDSASIVICCPDDSPSQIHDNHTILRLHPSKGKKKAQCNCDDHCVDRFAKALCKKECKDEQKGNCAVHESIATHYSAFLQSKQEVLWHCICSIANQFGFSDCCYANANYTFDGSSIVGSRHRKHRVHVKNQKRTHGHHEHVHQHNHVHSHKKDNSHNHVHEHEHDKGHEYHDHNHEQSEQGITSTIETDIESALETEKLTLSINGMTCSSCERKAFTALQKTVGVSNISVNFLFSKGVIEYNTRLTTPKKICSDVQRMTGFKTSIIHSDESQYYCMTNHELKCNEKGVSLVNDNTWKIEYDPTVINARDKIASLGLTPNDIIPNEESDEDKHPKLLGCSINQEIKNQFMEFLVALLLTVPILVLSWGSFTESTKLARSSIMLALATLIQILCARKIYISVYLTLRHGYALDSDCLVALSTSISYIYSLVVFILHRYDRLEDEDEIYESASLLLTLVLFGKLITAIIRLAATAQLKFDFYQPTMLTLEEFPQSTIAASLLQYGDRILLRKDEKAVTDGIIVSGFGEFDESHVTGESLPVYKKRGNEILAGAQMVSDSEIVFRATRLVPENSVSNVKVLVNSVSSFRTKQSDTVEKIAKYLTPSMIIVACLVFLIWMLINTLGTRKWSSSKAGSDAITYAIATLAVSCPCALVLSIPLVLSVGIAVGKQKYGLLLKSASPTDIAHEIKHVVFDKTGTLTTDMLNVNYVWINQNVDLPTRSLIRAVVTENSHPISRAVALYINTHRENDEKEEDIYPVGEIEQVVGSGIKTTFQDPQTEKTMNLVCGKPSFVGIPRNNKRIKPMLANGSSLFCVGLRNGPVLAIFGISSTLRAKSATVVSTLQMRGIKVHVLSGDTTSAVSTVCSALGISEFLAETSPEGKLDYITALRQTQEKVLFCGDGANDAIALAEADIGLSMTSEGITFASSDACVLDGDIAGVLRLLDLSREIRWRVLLAIAWSLTYNFFAVLLVAGAFVRVQIGPAWSGVSEVISIVPVFVIAMSVKLARSRI